MRSNSVLITGGTGTLGHGLVEKLLSMEVGRICILSRGEKNQANMARKFSNDRLRFFIGDVRDRWRLRRAMDGCEVVIHAAALKRIEVGVYNPVEMKKTNIDGSENVIEAARDAGVAKAILISTDKACEPLETNPYGLSKAMAERFFLSADAWHGPTQKTRYAVVRYGNVWKSNGSVVPLWQSILASGGTPLITDPECTRFFMKVEEAVNFVLAAIHNMRGGELFVPELPAYRLGDLACAIPGMATNHKICGLPPQEKMHESMVSGVTSKDARRMTIEELRSHL